jgi:hypothetical protein
MDLTAGRYSHASRGLLSLAALALIGVLVGARALEPEPVGRGTHTQLGLPACGFAARTGQPCPGCGMTTAMAWMTRGRIDRAFVANPAGCVMAPACALLGIWLLQSAFAGRPGWGARSLDFPVTLVAVATAAVGLVAWTVRILMGRV